MLHESPDFWKIDIPDSLTEGDVATSLRQHLDFMAANESMWPADSLRAARMATRHVLMSLYGIGVPQTGASLRQQRETITAEERTARERTVAENTRETAREARESVERAGERVRTEAAELTREGRRAGRFESRLLNTVALPDGITAREGLPSDEAIHDVFAHAVVAAMTAGKLDDLKDQFVEGDRNRLGDDSAPGQRTEAGDLDDARKNLDQTIADFRKAWEAKYKDVFDMSEEDDIFAGYLAISEGEIGDPAAITHWPVAVTSDAPAAKIEGDEKQRNLDKGRNVAIVVLPAMGQVPEMTISMLHEAPDFWKIDIPNNMTESKLRQNLNAHIREFLNQQANWPADMDEARLHAAYHVFRAIYGLPTM
jgi:hypothetical protein